MEDSTFLGVVSMNRLLKGWMGCLWEGRMGWVFLGSLRYLLRRENILETVWEDLMVLWFSSMVSF